MAPCTLGSEGTLGRRTWGPEQHGRKKQRGTACESQSGVAGVLKALAGPCWHAASSSRSHRREGKPSPLAEQKSSGPPSLLLDNPPRPPRQERKWILRGPSLGEEVAKRGSQWAEGRDQMRGQRSSVCLCASSGGRKSGRVSSAGAQGPPVSPAHRALSPSFVQKPHCSDASPSR